MRELVVSVTLLCVLFIAKLGATPIVQVSIEAANIKTLGGWPLDRKWYAVAVRNLVAAGAKRIFIDIAFPNADLAHPESDEYFLQQLEINENVFLLAAVVPVVGDSVRVLGRRRLPAHRFFAPFSGMFDIQDDMLQFNKAGFPSFAGLLLGSAPTPNQALVAFPKQPPDADYQFLQCVKNQIDCAGADVVIGLDYPGASSYIVNNNTQSLLTTTQLQLHAVRKILLDDYYRKWPAWLIGAGFSLSLLPLIGVKLSAHKTKWSFLSFLLGVSACAFFIVYDIFITDIWYAVLLVPMAFVIYGIYDQNLGQRADAQEAPKPVVTSSTAGDSHELDDLRYKLKFYEHLEQQVPPTEISTFREKAGIIHHKDSPLPGILRKARKVAQSDVHVMLFGESGTGKEKLARFIHECSARASKPLVTVNCASLNDNLIESELFGHEAGAFTGASKQKIGRFEMADGGTLFLDEIGETSPSTQVKLLRVLQDGVFERVGGTESVKVSVRILTATHQDLQAAISEKRFREDLFFRLNGFTLQLPPLRERPMDIEELFRVFLFEKDHELQISPNIIEWLKVQNWKGNVRELKSATERAVINAHLNNRQFLVQADFEIDQPVMFKESDSEQVSLKILEALRKYQFKHRSISAVASELALHRVTVTEYLRGWVTRSMLRYGSDAAAIGKELAGNSIVLDLEQFSERIQKYMSSIKNRIDEGLEKRETDSEIRLSRFKGLPNEFERDLTQLVTRIRNGEM